MNRSGRLYERIADHKREDETGSETFESLIDGYLLLDFPGGYSEEDTARHRDRRDRSERAATDDHRELLE